MAITTVTKPNQALQTGDENALKIEKFTGVVEGTIARESLIRPYVNFDSVRDTNVISRKAVGAKTLKVLSKGEQVESTGADFSKLTLHVDVVLNTADVLWGPEEAQTDFDAKMYLAREQGSAVAQMYDESLLIQAVKAGLATTSPYGTVDGFSGGSQQVLANASDALDPTIFYNAFAALFAKMMNKRVRPVQDNVIVVVRPDQFMTLLQSEHVLNGEYKTADGTNVKAAIFQAFGVPVINSVDLPGRVITGHQLSTTQNGNAFDGDFSKVVASVFSSRALFAGETLPVTNETWRDPKDKCTYIDTTLMYSVTPNRSEYAGVILTP